MLIVVASTDSMWAHFHDSTGLLNDLPDWWHHLILPWPFDSSLLSAPEFLGSISRFWYLDSHGRIKVAGELFADSLVLFPYDPSYEDAMSPDPMQAFGAAQAMAVDLIQWIDPYVDFSLYDRNGDGMVDPGAITLIIPYFRWGWSNLKFGGFSTDDGVLITPELNGGVSVVGYGLSLHQVLDPDTTPPSAPNRSKGFHRFRYGITHEYGHHLGLPDKYDRGEGDSLAICQIAHPHSKSSREGIYSLMVTLLPRPAPGLFPLSPYDRWAVSRLFTYTPIIEINGETGMEGLVLHDILSPNGVIYRIPVLTPFEVLPQFLLLGAYFQDSSSFTAPYRSSGLLVQLVTNRSEWDDEKIPPADNLLAVGLWDTSGVALSTSTEKPVWGYDLHDVGIGEWGYVPQGYGTFVAEHVIDHDPMNGITSSYDLFPTTLFEKPRNALTAFTNPSSNGYAVSVSPELTRPEDRLEGYIRRDTFPAGSLVDTILGRAHPNCNNVFSYPSYTERNAARLLATHVVIRSIAADKQNRRVTLDLYTNFIQTDRDSALGHPQERRLLAGGPSWGDTLFMLYQSGNVIYLTRATGAPDDLGWTWEAGWPMDTLGHHPALARFTEWISINPTASLIPVQRVCAVYARETHLFRSCWWQDTLYGSVHWRWIPRETLAVFDRPVRFHTLSSTGIWSHHAVVVDDGVKTELFWLLSGPQGERRRASLDRWASSVNVEADVAALDSGRVALVYARGPEIWAAFRSGGTWNRLLFSTSGTTPLVDTLAGGYLFAWQEGDSIRVVWRDDRGKGGSPYGLTNGTLLALEGGVVLYRRSPLQPPASGLFKRVYDGTSWGPEVYLMDPGNLTGFHIAPTGDGQVRMVAVQPTGWDPSNFPGSPPYRVIDFAETGVGGSQAGEVRVYPTLVVRPLPGGLAVQVGSGWSGVRYALFDAAGRRVADVRVEGIRAVLPMPRSGVYVLRATLPDGRTLQKKVVFAR